MEVVIASAVPHEYAAACRFAFATHPAADDAAGLYQVKFLVNELDSRGLLVAKYGGQIVGAIFAYEVGPGQGAILPPGARSGMVATQLLEAALVFLRSLRVRVVQSIVSTISPEAEAAMLGVGFVATTELLFFRLENLKNRAATSSEALLEFRPQAAPTPTLSRILERTYIESRDCAELNGLRTGEEILAGYFAENASATVSVWQLESDAAPVGILVLTKFDPPARELDLTYLGLVPEARGRGMGRTIVEFVQRTAHEQSLNSIELNVDARNLPALALYARFGFVGRHRRQVYLKLDCGT